jgi:hypothetical protein
MFKLKSLSKSGLTGAIKKAERYRLLNQPKLAESICLDILEVDPDNHDALIMLLLSITDQFGIDGLKNEKRSRELLPRFKDEYERNYYAGIICERLGTATINKGFPGSIHNAYEWMRDAMEYFEKAEAIRPSGNDDSILRWNTCVRLIERHKLEPKIEDSTEQFLE